MLWRVQPGEVIRQRRIAHGLTQAALGLRAGTSQTALSRLERGDISPTFATIQRLLFVMGETAELVVTPLEGDHDPAHLADLLARPPEERLELAISWNRLAGEVAAAGKLVRAGS